MKCALCIVSCLVCFLVGVSGEVEIERPSDVNNHNELVIEKGAEFTLTCRGDTPLSWNYTYYEPLDGDIRSQVRKLDKNEYGEYKSTLIVEKAYFMDTGYFYCFPASEDYLSPWAKNIYVYVKDPDHPLALYNTIEMTMLTVHLNDTVVFPCRPTDPELQVELRKEDPDPVVKGANYDPHKGFTFLVEDLSQHGSYYCEVNHIKSIEFLLLGPLRFASENTLEKPHITIHPDPVAEGSNVTFGCYIDYATGVTIDIIWIYSTHIQEERVNSSNTTSEDIEKGGTIMGQKGHRSLTIYDVNKKDEGNYTCIVVDDSGNRQELTHPLKVLNESTLDLKLRGQSPITAQPGKHNVTVIVDIMSHPPATKVQWLDFDQKFIIDNQGPVYAVNRTAKSSTLIILKPKVELSGNYSLFVDNGIRKKTLNVSIHIKGRPQLYLNGGERERFFMVGQEHKIECDVYAIPRPTITWFFKPCSFYPKCSTESKPIPFGQYEEMDTNCARGLIKSTVHLMINETGEIICKAQNSIGTNTESVSVLATDVKNGFMLDYPNMVIETDNITLSCGVSKYHYSNEIQWIFTNVTGDRKTTTNSDFRMWTEESKYSYYAKLNIPSVNINQTGNYSCVAKKLFSRDKKQQVSSYEMIVKTLKKPVIERNVNKTREVMSGTTVELICEVDGAPTPDILWFKDGTQLGSHSKYAFPKDKKKLKMHIGLEDDGNYVCEAHNKHGHDRLEFRIIVKDKTNKLLFIFSMFMLSLLVIIVAVLAVLYARRTNKLRKEIKQLKEAGLLNFEEGRIECLNPDLDIGEQANLLPYDRNRWEFPRDKLKFGKQLGAGAFGVVMKAEAYELMEEGVATTVAVKMVKQNCDVATIKALASELKIMTHLGKHINIVNILGACTGDLNKRELLVLVEYCQYGNLHNYLLKHRGAFINQVNHLTGNFDPTLIQPLSPTSSARFSDVFNDRSDLNQFANGQLSLRDSAVVSAATDTTLVSSDMTQKRANVYVETTPIGDDGYLVSRDHEWRNKDRGDYKNGLKPVCTQDLICWSFQIARGMEYLASRKVLHGDLAARNVLLAEENIVKICDFGFSKSMYADDCYQKKGDGPLPVKWMALESILDKVFSTQSDVWSFGVTMWELFSLARTPYPDMEFSQKLITSLQRGYRMEHPKYATKQLYKVMKDCWHINPNTRPSFTELAERLGGMLEDTVRIHYVDLNDPYLQDNRELLAQQDYLSLLRSPNYSGCAAPSSDYCTMKPIEEPMELTPMLANTVNISRPHTPDSPTVISLPSGNNYVNVTQLMSFSNPSYQNLGRPKQSPYMNMPQ